MVKAGCSTRPSCLLRVWLAWPARRTDIQQAFPTIACAPICDRHLTRTRRDRWTRPLSPSPAGSTDTARRRHTVACRPRRRRRRRRRRAPGRAPDRRRAPVADARAGHVVPAHSGSLGDAQRARRLRTYGDWARGAPHRRAQGPVGSRRRRSVGGDGDAARRGAPLALGGDIAVPAIADNVLSLRRAGSVSRRDIATASTASPRPPLALRFRPEGEPDQ